MPLRAKKLLCRKLLLRHSGAVSTDSMVTGSSTYIKILLMARIAKGRGKYLRYFLMTFSTPTENDIGNVNENGPNIDDLIQVNFMMFHLTVRV